MTTVVSFTSICGDGSDRVAAPGAGVVLFAVHLQKIPHFPVYLVAYSLAEDPHRFGRDRIDRSVQRDQFMCRESRYLLERVKPGFVEDFIGIGVADARNQPSPCQHALHFTVKWFQAKLEIVERKWLVNHIGRQVFKSDNFAALTGREIVDLPHFFWLKYLRCMPDFISKMRTVDAATLADALHHINLPVSIGLMINS